MWLVCQGRGEEDGQKQQTLESASAADWVGDGGGPYAKVASNQQ